MNVEMHCGLQAIYECLYGRGTTGRLKQAGMEFAVWTFKHGASSQLEEAGPGILQALLALLEDGAALCPLIPAAALGSRFLPSPSSRLYATPARFPDLAAVHHRDGISAPGWVHWWKKPFL